MHFIERLSQKLGREPACGGIRTNRCLSSWQNKAFPFYQREGFFFLTYNDYKPCLSHFPFDRTAHGRNLLFGSMACLNHLLH